MILVEPLEDLPRDLLENLGTVSLAEWKQLAHRAAPMIERSYRRAMLRNERGDPLAAIGLYNFSFASRPPELWLLVGKELELNFRTYARELRKMLDEVQSVIPDIVVTCETETSARFARFFGFEMAEADSFGNQLYRRN